MGNMTRLSISPGSCQVTLRNDATDPPDLKTAKDQGDQTQLDVSRVEMVHHTTC